MKPGYLTALAAGILSFQSVGFAEGVDSGIVAGDRPSRGISYEQAALDYTHTKSTLRQIGAGLGYGGYVAGVQVMKLK